MTGTTEYQDVLRAKIANLLSEQGMGLDNGPSIIPTPPPQPHPIAVQQHHPSNPSVASACKYCCWALGALIILLLGYAVYYWMLGGCGARVIVVEKQDERRQY